MQSAAAPRAQSVTRFWQHPKASVRLNKYKIASRAAE